MVYTGATVFKKRNKSSQSVEEKAKTNRRRRVIFPKQLLITEKRKAWMQTYQTVLEFSKDKYQSVCDALLMTLASYTQDLPETRNSYFSNVGGFLNHAMMRTEMALSAARAYFVSDNGEPCKKLSPEQQLWMYALFSAGLLKGVGKLAVDFMLDMYDANGEYTERWQILKGSLKDQNAHFYDYNFDGPYTEPFRHRMTLLLARQIMPKEGFDWIASDKDVLATWLALLEDDIRGAGTLGTILDKADQLAISRFFNERAIADYNKDLPSGHGRTFGVPKHQDIGDLKAGEIPQAGVEFIKWLTKALGKGHIMVNQSPLFMVPGGMLMSPDMFKLFIREHPQFKAMQWQEVEAAFLQMDLHAKDADGKANMRFMQNKTQQVHTGVVLAAIGVVLPERVKTVNLNNGVVKTVSASDLMGQKMAQQHFSQVTTGAKAAMHLSSSGQWQAAKGPAQGPGQSHGAKGS